MNNYARELPNSELDERYVLASILRDGQWVGEPLGVFEIAEMIGPDHQIFYCEWIRRSYAECVLHIAEDAGQDAVRSDSVGAMMESLGIGDPAISRNGIYGRVAMATLMLPEIQTRAGLTIMPEFTASAVRDRVARLKEYFSRRQVISVGQRAVTAALGEDGGRSAEMVEAMRSGAEAIVDAAHGATYLEGYDYIRLADATPDDAGGMETGFAGFKDFWRLHPGRVYTILADTGFGKSQLAGQVAEYVAHTLEKRVLWFSTEMSGRDSAQRTLARIARVNLTRLMEGELMPEEQKRADHMRDYMLRGNFIFTDVSGCRMSELVTMANAVHRRKPLDLVVIDHFHDLLRSVDVRVEAGNDANAATSLAKRLGVPIIVPVQGTKEGSKREGGMRREDVMESAAIVQAADMVLILHRPNMDPDEELREGQREEVIIVKSKDRQGPYPRRRPLQFWGDCVRFDVEGSEPRG